MPNIEISELKQAISKELTIYSSEVINAIKKQTKKSMQQLVKNTKATAPVGKGTEHLKDQIASKKEEETDTSLTMKWYVKGNRYRIAHLVENGHALKNGGRSKATHFIKNASEPILDNYVKEVEEICKNGK